MSWEMTGLTGKIALVTGSSRGLGRNTALRLAANGADILLTYRSQQADGEAVAAEIARLGRKAALLPLDVAEVPNFPAFRDAVAGVLQAQWQRPSFDFLINNAGIDVAAQFADTTEEAFDRLLNVHFRGTFFLTQKLLPLLADGGRIVNTSTGLTRFAIPGYSAYASMKGALEVWTKYLAKELGARKISANIIAPGAIETDFNTRAFEHAEVKDFLAAQTALGRVGVPDDIGGVVVFLCSEEGRWINGQRLEVSGGMFL